MLPCSRLLNSTWLLCTVYFSVFFTSKTPLKQPASHGGCVRACVCVAQLWTYGVSVQSGVGGERWLEVPVGVVLRWRHGARGRRWRQQVRVSRWRHERLLYAGTLVCWRRRRWRRRRAVHHHHHLRRVHVALFDDQVDGDLALQTADVALAEIVAQLVHLRRTAVCHHLNHDHNSISCKYHASNVCRRNTGWVTKHGIAEFAGRENDGLELVPSNWLCYWRWRFALNLHTIIRRPTVFVRLCFTRCGVICACC